MAGLYLHIPFCKRRCLYCDFYSTTMEERKEEYVRALCRELELRKEYLQGEPLETLYLGGGTPSQLNQQALEQIFETVERVYGLSQCSEITLEANPDDLSEAYVRMLRTLPVNRLSMGVQTFNEEKLRFLHRRHTAAQAIEAVRRCQEAGLTNLSVDLIYGLPGEQPSDWEADLQQAVALQVPHLSAYHLIYEEGTELYRLLEAHRVEEVDEELSVRFFRMLIEQLRAAGYEHYEISNFALPDHYARHNTAYWTGRRYLGAGPSAHSYNGVTRQWNVASLTDYIEALLKEGRVPFELEELDRTTRYNERVITSLRTMWGLNLTQLEQEFGRELVDYCLRNAQPHLQEGRLKKEKDTLKLTAEGIFLSDGIMSDLLSID
jgi:oxygen-independent coproporphyrinogen-3 oxidase